MTGRSYAGEVIEPFVSDEQRALWPAVSGNDINGRGETAPRRPSAIYWHPPRRQHPFADIQSWMLRKSSREVPVIADMNTTLGGRGDKQRTEMAGMPEDDSVANWVTRVKATALESEADIVGIAQVRPEWIYDGYDNDLSWTVIFGVEMNHAELAAAPEPESVIEVMRQYNRGTRVARKVADWILARGYRAEPEGGPIAGKLPMIPAALACGFGELGKHGSIINRTYGSSFRLASVLTDLPLAADAPDPIGVDDFCLSCKLCEQACPTDAISPEKQLVRGETKWYVDFDACVPYFNETYGCGICIAVCPWSRPGIAPKLAEKMARRRKN
jgi:NAD-dependent dihydropyrimidine dehydrogenase PreA subunit